MQELERRWLPHLELTCPSLFGTELPENTLASSITGAGIPFYNPLFPIHEEQMPSHIFHKKSNPIGARVPQRICEKIITDQYIDLASLLEPTSSDSLTQGHGMVYTPIGNGDMRPVLRKKSQGINTISQWVKAFHVFIALYSKSHLTQAPNLMKYLTLVESIAEEGGDWQTYDQTFRYERAAVAGGIKHLGSKFIKSFIQ